MRRLQSWSKLTGPDGDAAKPRTLLAHPTQLLTLNLLQDIQTTWEIRKGLTQVQKHSRTSHALTFVQVLVLDLFLFHNALLDFRWDAVIKQGDPRQKNFQVLNPRFDFRTPAFRHA